MPENRIDRLALRLAGAEPEISSAAPVVDRVARALDASITRRRAVALIGGAAIAGSLIRPGRAAAQNCYPGGPKICSNSKGARVCVPDNLACCSNDNCAIACPYPWRICEQPGNCADTARMCTDTTNPDYERGTTKFCSQRVLVTNGCSSIGSSFSIRGWCCEPKEQCGEEFGECVCPKRCGDNCCKTDEVCVDDVCKPKCRDGWHWKGDKCVCDEGQTCGVNCCPEGSSCRGSTCFKPKENDKLPSLWDSFMGFGDVASQSAAGHGGPRSQSIRAAQAPEPVRTALLALAAVSAQGAVAASAFESRRPDRGYRRKVVAARPGALRIPPGEGLDPRAASALEALVNAEAKGFALALACAKALARARGATARRDFTRVRKQVLSAAGFAKASAKALRPVPSLRAKAFKALSETGATEVVASPADVAALQADVRASGVP
ncbi:MAG TPA: hypothetical protein VK486_05580, partial [Thermoleophilaceae bacterium]|nr:hypothetical protein [Thermoleophilaceae bacterium]